MYLVINPVTFKARLCRHCKARWAVNGQPFTSMVTLASEVEEARALLERAHASLLEEDQPAELPPLGIMLEVPAAVFRIEELAGNPLGALLLLGLGVDALSMAPGNIPRVKRVIRGFSGNQARELWESALKQDSPGKVRQMLTEALEQKGLGDLIRPDK